MQSIAAVRSTTPNSLRLYPHICRLCVCGLLFGTGTSITPSSAIQEDDPIQETVHRMRTLGVNIVVFRLGGTRPDEGDYLTVMRGNLERLQTALSAPTQP